MQKQQQKSRATRRKATSTRAKRQPGGYGKWLAVSFVVLALAGGMLLNQLMRDGTKGQVEGLSTPPAGKQWGLVFSDDFSGSALNGSNWGYQTGSWTGSNVQNCYTSSTNNVYVSGGTLKIKALYAPGTTCSGVSRDFTSGFIQSKDRKTWTYGYFESRIKMPTNNGSMWPAFWMSPQSGTYGAWPRSGEIDIFEQKGYNTTNIYANAIWGTSSSSKSQKQGIGTVDSAGNWHVYALEWSEGVLKYYIDGSLYHTISSFPSPNATTYPGPFNIPFYIRLNMAVGGTYLAAPYSDAHNSIANFPATMEVDYVHVYQLEDVPPSSGGSDPGAGSGGGSTTTDPPASTPSSTPSTTTTTQSPSTATSSGGSTDSTSGNQSNAASDTTKVSADTESISLSPEIAAKVAEIARVEYLIDGKVIQSYTSSPFDLQTKDLPTGTITVVERITYKDGKVTEESHTLQIAPTATTRVVKTAAVGGSIGVVVLAVVFIVLYKYGPPKRIFSQLKLFVHR